jgi:putative ABC transport system permease protein
MSKQDKELFVMEKISNNSKPPRIAEWLIKQLSWYEDREAILDNLREEYDNNSSIKGYFFANCWYWFHLLRTSLPLIIYDFKWRIVMLTNYLKIAIRNLKKYKTYSIINIIGLTLGIACCLFIYLYVKTEYSYDHFHKDLDRIFRVGLVWKFETGENHWTTISTPAMQTIKEYSDDVEHIARIKNYSTQLVRYDNKMFYETNCIFADPEIFKVLTIPFLIGNPETAVKRPNTIVINKRMATKY